VLFQILIFLDNSLIHEFDGHRRPIGEIQVNLAHQYRFCRWGFIPSDERKILYSPLREVNYGISI
jgi:hypothetical protein